MKIEIKETCYGDNIVFNGKAFDGYSIKERKVIIKNLLDSIDDNNANAAALLDTIATDIVRTLGEAKETTYCEQCGSYNTDYHYEF